MHRDHTTNTQYDALAERMHIEFLARKARAEAEYRQRFGWQSLVRTPGCRAHKRWKTRRASGRH